MLRQNVHKQTLFSSFSSSLDEEVLAMYVTDISAKQVVSEQQFGVGWGVNNYSVKYLLGLVITCVLLN